MRKKDLRGTLNYIQKLERFTILEIPPQAVPEVVDILFTAAKMRIKVELIDRILGEILTKIEHYSLLQEAVNLKEKIEQ